jgi:hypothetical protein
MAAVMLPSFSLPFVTHCQPARQTVRLTVYGCARLGHAVTLSHGTFLSGRIGSKCRIHSHHGELWRFVWPRSVTMSLLLPRRISVLAVMTISVSFSRSTPSAMMIRGALGLSLLPQRSEDTAHCRGVRNEQLPPKDHSLRGRREVLKQASASVASWALALPAFGSVEEATMTAPTGGTDTNVPSSTACSLPSSPVVQQAYRVVPDVSVSLNPKLVPITVCSSVACSGCRCLSHRLGSGAKTDLLRLEPRVLGDRKLRFIARLAR